MFRNNIERYIESSKKWIESEYFFDEKDFKSKNPTYLFSVDGFDYFKFGFLFYRINRNLNAPADIPIEDIGTGC
jgi:hypothetical protein